MNLVAVQIMEANYHHGGMKIARLFAVEDAWMSRLSDDVLRIVATFPPSDVSEAGHVTNWTRPVGEALQFSLFNISGRTDDTSQDHQRTQDGKSFAHAGSFPAIAELVDTLRPAGLTGMRINFLGPKSGLSPHEEHIVHRGQNGSAELRVRFHLPVFTNDRCRVLLDGDEFRMDRGYVYFFNNGCVHASKNEDEHDGRFHLVWDMMLSKACCEAMFERQISAPFFIPAAIWTVRPIRTGVDAGRFETYPEEVSYEEASRALAFAP